MRINLISGLNENDGIENVCASTQVYAWFLNKAFTENGVESRLVSDASILRVAPPEADHTVVISASALTNMRAKPEYVEMLRESTGGKIVRYMNADRLRGHGDRFFDICFTQIPPMPRYPEEYVCAGWGVDPTYSYPEQEERAVFLDSKTLWARALRKFGDAYRIYDEVLPRMNVKTYNPVPIYGEGKKLPYPKYQSILRRCSYFLCTQFGEGGINRLEAAACGALLVVPEKLHRERTMSLLNHAVWRTKEELVNILRGDVDIEANRRKALEHRWKNVAERILGALEEDVL